MRNIAKGLEPRSLTLQRATYPTNYEGYRQWDTLRASLHEEQRGICCYCMGRIRAHGDKMKIEHWQSYSRYPTQRLVYSNLLGACLGRQGQDQHCDTYKGNKDLSRNPANPAHNVEAFIRYLRDGMITASDPVFDGQLNTVLNLNLAFLMNSRRSVARAFEELLARRQGTLSRETWESLLGEWTGDSPLRPYCGVVVYYIRKKLARV